jgi:hypothetical protein
MKNVNFEIFSITVSDARSLIVNIPRLECWGKLCMTGRKASLLALSIMRNVQN